jgi:hypothetical protein
MVAAEGLRETKLLQLELARPCFALAVPTTHMPPDLRCRFRALRMQKLDCLGAMLREGGRKIKTAAA